MKKQNRKWSALGRRGLASLLVAVMMMGFIMPVYATGDVTEPTEPVVTETTAPTVPETTAATQETTEPASSETSEPATSETTEPVSSETTEPASSETSEPATSETTVPASSETSAPSVGDDAPGTPDKETVPDATVPQQTPPAKDQIVTSPAPDFTAYDRYRIDLAALEEEAKTLEATEEVLDEFYERLFAVINAAQDEWEKDTITAEEMDALNNTGYAIMLYLKDTYGYENGEIQTLDEDKPLSNKAIDTATRAESGIIFELFNYGEYINFKDKTSKDTTNLAPHAGCIPFTGTNNVDKSTSIPHHEKAHLGADRLLYKMNLSATHYPVIKQCSKPDCTKGCGVSVGYLFGEGTHHSVTPHKAITNTPLTYDPVTGYYSYSSATNAADLSVDKTKIYVRDYEERGPSAANYVTESMADFFPFNSLVGAVDNDGTTNVKHYVSNKGVEYQYQTNQIDYWFGARMHATFYAPKDSMVNGQPMKYEFSGDDDVMVYIDDVYVMDLGGAHAKCSGEINFYNGLVETWYDCDGEDHRESVGAKYYAETIYDRYKAAYIEKNPALATDEANLEKMLAEVFVPVMKTDGTQEEVTDARGQSHKVYRFKDYTNHTFDWFYMERWSSLANFNTKFNLPTLPENSLTVLKEVAETTTDKAFEYEIELKNQEGQPLKSVQYKIDNKGEELNLPLDANGKGKFSVKDGQQYVFLGITGGTQYKVTELDANQGGYKTAAIGETTGSMDDEPIVCGYVNVYQPDDEDGDKTVSEKGLDEFILSLNAFTYGTEFESSSRVPTDIVLAIDTSGSMHQLTVKATQPVRVYDYTTDGWPYVDYLADKTWLNADAAGVESSGLGLAPYARVSAKASVASQTNAITRALNNKDYLNEAKGNKYYILDGAEFVEIDWCETCGDWHPATATDCNIKYTPKKTPTDTEGVQFYTVGYVSRMDATINSLIDFIYAVENQAKEKNVAHRIAIVTFQDRDDKDEGSTTPYHTGLWKNGTMYSYLTPAELTAQYGTAYTTMSTSGAVDSLLKSLENFNDTSYHSVGTFPAPGIEMAKEIFDANSIQGTDRNRVLIMFTDGTPTYPDGTHDYEDARTPALLLAKELKRDTEKLQVYAVGMFEGASVTENAIGNNFCHWISSNVDMELGNIDEPDTSKLANYSTLAEKYENVYKGKGVWKDYPINRDGGYYFPATDSDELNNVFSSIVNSVTGGTESVLDENAVMRDILSEHVKFDDLAVDADAAAIEQWIKENVKLYTQDYTGNGNFASEKVPYTEELTVTVDPVTKTINVTRFPYDEHWCGPEIDANGTVTGYHGKRLVVEFPVESDCSGGNQLPTNEAPDSGVYVDGTAEKPVIEFPLPYVDLSADVTVKKNVKGNMGDWSKFFSFTPTGTVLVAEKDNEGYYSAGQLTVTPPQGVTASNYLAANTGALGDDAKFQLKHWLESLGNVEIIKNLKVGTELTITEVPEQYEVTIKVNGTEITDAEKVLEGEKLVGVKTSVQPGMEIEFTNRYEVTIDTGIALDSLPYILIIAIVVVGGAVLFLRKRKPQDD